MKVTYLLFIVALFFLSSCEKEKDIEVKSTITKSEINGLVQKGPFLNGTSIEIYENNSPTPSKVKVYQN